MKLRLFLALFLFIPLSAQAQNKIIVIGEDGKKQEITLDQPQINPVEPEPAKESAPQISEPAPLSASDLMRIEDPASPKPAPATQTQQSVPKPQKAVVKPPAIKRSPVKQTSMIPIPPRKPSAEDVARWVEESKPVFNFVDPKNIPPDVAITRDLAVRVALEVAPPSRGYEVFRTDYKDRPAYQVRFKTEAGPHDVVVDAESGEVLKK